MLENGIWNKHGVVTFVLAHGPGGRCQGCLGATLLATVRTLATVGIALLVAVGHTFSAS